ncbi:uncharacterized protein N7469_004573 [Penicillium citrinum]|uniref:Uncharacterized protein n=1 Tax=Penicillium citrinum TaxID=5077 RepID=A0A9W9TQP4_PENCI|nr:uncharacterized protein N7469_004573 [Penicillium citrinum]KAJ5235405.1 hypothetical protein N7469_004573 [Penicillium citrinum]
MPDPASLLTSYVICAGADECVLDFDRPMMTYSLSSLGKLPAYVAQLFKEQQHPVASKVVI